MEVLDFNMLEELGWLLAHSFTFGLVCLPLIWVLRTATRRCNDATRSAISLVTLVVVTIAPLATAALLASGFSTKSAGLGDVAVSARASIPPIGTKQDIPPYEGSGRPVFDDEGRLAEAVQSNADWSVVTVLPFAWGLGAMFTASFLMFGLMGSVRLRYQTLELPEPMRQLVQETLGAFSESQIKVRLSDLVSTPILLGVIRPVILLPCTAVGWTPETIRFVVLHEFAHARRWDNLINLAQRIVESVCFYQPAVWLASGWVRSEREICCDRFVANTTKAPNAYAETLVRLANERVGSYRSTDLVTCSSTRHALVVRVTRLLGKEETMKLRFRTVLLSLLVLGLSLAVSYSAVLAPQQDADLEATHAKPKEPPVVPPAAPLTLRSVLTTDQVVLNLHSRATVFAKTAGVLKSVHLQVGHEVKKGQVLGQLDTTVKEAELARLRNLLASDIEVRFAKKALEVATDRYRTAMKKKESYSPAELRQLLLELERSKLMVEKAELARKATEREVKAVEASVRDCRFEAPIDGKISEVTANPGEAIKAGDALLQITSLKQLSCEFHIPVKDVAKVARGMIIRFAPREQGFPTLTGTIRYIGAEVSRVGQTLRVVGILDNPEERVRAGQRGKLHVMEPVPVRTVQDKAKAGRGKAIEITIRQRRSKLIPGTKTRVIVGDITGGQVLVSIKDGDGRRLVDEKSLSLGDIVAFEANGEESYLRIRQLTNLLIGEDFTILEVSGDRADFTPIGSETPPKRQ